MTSPAGSSAAWLMRSPLDRRWMLVLTLPETFCRLRRAFSAVTLVLICNPIIFPLLLHDVRVQRHPAAVTLPGEECAWGLFIRCSHRPGIFDCFACHSGKKTNLIRKRKPPVS